MAEIDIKVEVFDPAVPFRTFILEDPAIDTWHTYTLITKEARAKLLQVPNEGIETLQLSGGMSMQVPYVLIGVKVGTIKIENVKALVVDKGYHQILLGNELINKAFKIGKSEEENVSVSSEWKEDSTALSVELFPVNTPFDIRHFEAFLRQQRRLYNIFLLLDGEVNLLKVDDIDVFIEEDEGIDPAFRLQLSWIDSGSIWISLKSGSQKTLRRLASLFDTSASAKLAQQMADAKKAETEASITQDIRDATARRLHDEQEMLRAGNIKKTYDTWRREVKARIKFINEMIEEVQDEAIRQKLIKHKNEAIDQLAESQLLPMVRNVPRPYEPPEGIFLLPPAPSE